MRHIKEQWVNEVLASTGNIKPATLNTSLYPKIMGRLKTADRVPAGVVFRIAAGITLLVALNVFACLLFSKQTGNRQSDKLQAFAHEYGLNNAGNF